MVARKPIKVREVQNSDNYTAFSRYRGTRYFQRTHPGVGSFVEPETWEPKIIPRRADDKFTEVRAGEEGRLDLISLRVYRNSALWWVIAYANDIVDPFTQAYNGRTIRYPIFDVVMSTILA